MLINSRCAMKMQGELTRGGAGGGVDPCNNGQPETGTYKFAKPKTAAFLGCRTDDAHAKFRVLPKISPAVCGR